jgi:predicted nucleotide-binding protein (sugar kinase/HSP70/actin superfamily)
MSTLNYEQIEAELKSYEEQERRRLGLVEEKIDHWIDPNPQRFTESQRAHTTILFGGLTLAQDRLVAGALQGLGYKVQPMDVPDNDSLRFGKEFGNRGQCNPTYFTVGNLLKHLTQLRAQGLSSQEIVDKYLFFTAGACGPCRFGTYTTEYRKALRDAGFDGFRVLLFQQQGGLKQATGEGAGLKLEPKFFIALLQAVMAGDVLNAAGYRLRPYEVNPGQTDQALEQCKDLLHEAFIQRRSILRALYACRRLLSQVQVNRLQPKPKVSIIGEFWAMTTEGDGNYRLQRFLESEGAEVDIQLVTAWLLYNIWQVRWDTKRRMTLRGEDEGRQGLKGKNPRKRLASLWVADKALRGMFSLFCRIIGLKHYHLPDMDEIATISHAYYNNHLRGGEGHMEVGKLMLTAKKRKAHLVISVKPFGCMPSAGVSDGVQSLITAKYPQALFLAIETTGDGAANVQSRVQMDLFKARKAAVQEFDDLLDQAGVSPEEAQQRMARSRLSHPLHYPPHRIAGTAANQLAELLGHE